MQLQTTTIPNGEKIMSKSNKQVKQMIKSINTKPAMGPSWQDICKVYDATAPKIRFSPSGWRNTEAALLSYWC